MKFLQQTKSPRLRPGAFTSLKQLAYLELEMKTQSALENVEFEVGTSVSVTKEGPALSTNGEKRIIPASVPQIDIQIREVQHPMLA
jgi:hypothetical protein